MNTCTICLTSKPWDNFPIEKKNRSGYKNQCKACLYSARMSSPEQKAKKYAAHQKWRWKAKYGITYDQYWTMWAIQGGNCAICGMRDENKLLSVDHDHETGKARKLLCSQCNLMIGNSDENPEILEAGAAYLRMLQSKGLSTPRIPKSEEV